MDGMTRENAPDRIEDFLWGRLNGENAAGFLTECAHDNAMRLRLEREAGLESLLYSMSWEIGDASGLKGFPSDYAISDPSTSLFQEKEWRGMIATAFETATEASTDRNSPIRRFPKIARYLAAAMLIGAVGIGMFFWNHTHHRTLIASVKTGHILETSLVEKTVLPREKKSLYFDSIVIYGSSALSGKPVATAGRDGILKIGEKTAILLDKNSSVAVRSHSDSSIAIDLTHGGALFTVEKHRYARFSVATPGGEIAVTGTIFRLAVVGDTTIVSVLEGAVKARRKGDTAYVSVPAGMSARIRPDAVILDNGDSAATLLFRCNLLHDFLKENAVRDEGRFVREGLKDSDLTSSPRSGSR
jgi:hypothetical protein